MSGEHTHAAHAFGAADTSHGAGDWAAAVEHYTKAARFFKRGHMAAACHDRRGSCLAELDNLQEAIKSHTQAIELAPKMMSAWHNRGHAHMQLGDHESAIVDLERALRLDHSEETARLLEHATLELQCPPRAKAAFEKALDAYGLSEWNAARLMFEEALAQRHTRPARCLNGLGLAYAGLGQLDHALQAFDHALEAEPENPRPWHNRAQIKAKLGRDAEAKAEATMAAMLSAKDPSGGHTGRTTAGHLLELREAHPENVALKAFDPAYFQKLELPQQNALIRSLRAVIENPGTRMACFACQSEDYERFKPFFQHVVTAYHEVPLDAVHTSDWSLQGLPDLPCSGVLDLIQFGLPPMSVRVRAARNLTGFPLPAVMSRNERCELENVLLEAFGQLIENPEYGGRYHSFTPGHSHAIPPAEYQALLKQRLAFPDMSTDKSLLSVVLLVTH
jgi:tetratricopeptide (TPR) repeat protein